MKTYSGKRTDPARGSASPVEVIVIDSNKGKNKIYNLQHIMRHSPDGFNWGYGGSGPGDLARSILMDHFSGTTYGVEMIYMKFKQDFVAHFGDTWEITSDLISEWMEARHG